LKRADMILSTADGTPVDFFMERVGIRLDRYRKWLNGFPSLENNDGHRRADQIVCISRLSPEKGVDYVIRSYALARPHLHRHHTLVIVGGGESTDELKKLTRDLGIADYVRFEGDSFDIASYLYSSKLLVSGLANNPIMEAIATGTPVVAVELGETAELYGMYPNVHIVGYPPGGCGRIPAQYMDALCKDTAAVMVDVLNKYPRIENNAASNGRKLFGWDERLEQELDLYEAMFSDPEPDDRRSASNTGA
jgi:glycosyltransferase involved in cell wall biosynthesis